jgi:hypothetical protein
VTLFQVKEQGVLDTPLCLFDCTFSDGTVYNWSTHHVVVQGIEYQSRVMRTNVFQMQMASDGGVDTIPKISFELANADGLMSELQRSCGFKGAILSVSFVFYSLSQNAATTETLPLFQGILDSPELITESTFRVSAINRLSLQRIALPPVQVQKRCPWQFPTTANQRQEALNGGSAGRFSQFYNCGYSPDIPGGCGNLNNGTPFTSCDYSRTQCVQRGMFSTASSGETTARFGGIEFVPPVISVRASGAKSSQLSVVQDNEARYNDFVPLIYGTGWYYPGIVFARNDGNLTHFEVLLGSGQMTNVTTVLVNDIEIPIGRSGTNMTGTGWYNVVSYGTRNGVFNRDFADASGNPLGDPYGSMAYISIVVPNSINDGQSVPEIQVLIDGLQIESFAADGTSLGFAFINNPVWVILDILRRCGWALSEIDFTSFAQAAAYCDEQIQTTDLNGNVISIPRFQCNLILQYRRSAGDVIRCIRNASRLYLTYSSAGLLQMNVENTIALQQPQQIASSNAQSSLNGGWPVYEFGDGTNGTTGIARAADQSSTFQISSRASADTPNRFSIEFQDSFNSYQQDSVTLVDPDDVQKCGFQVSATPTVLGVPNYDQALRIVALCLEKSIAGNTYIEFQTSVRALGIQPGDIIAVTHSLEGFNRTPFRVVKVSPGQNYRTAVIRAQLHDDSWYTDDAGRSAINCAPQPSYSIGIPRSITGVTLDQQGNLQFDVTESASQAQDGTATLMANVAFASPPAVPVSAPGAPLASLAPTVSPTGGTLTPDSAFYYALTSVDSSGDESGLSFAILTVTGNGPATYAVTLNNISLPASAASFNLYRGPSPAQLVRISTNTAPSGTFTDAGLPNLQYLPPDANYDHANFYWRIEMQPPAPVTIYSANTVGTGSVQMQVNEFAGMTVRITTGKGAQQECVISSNTSFTLTTSSPWTVVPDTSSTFVISQTGYQFGASSNTNQVQFEIPNRPGTTIHICGRSANVYDVESPYELSTVTRWQIGGAGINVGDSAVPSAPVFGLTVLPEEGGVELCGLGFSTIENTRTISLGTITLYYYDESSVAAPPVLAAALAATDTTLTLSPNTAFPLPQYIAVDQEIIRLNTTTTGGTGFVVDRGLDTTLPAAHLAQAVALPLKQMTVSFPFLENFFGSPASGNWTQAIMLANARICSAELFFTNSRGNGPAAAGAFTSLVGGGLRTLNGGQVTLQVPGFLAVQDSAVPPLDPGATYSVRDVYAYVNTAPSGTTPITLQLTVNGQAYGAPIIIACDPTQSTPPVDGSTLPVLRAGGRIGLNIQKVGDQAPGADLTVVIRV